MHAPPDDFLLRPRQIATVLENAASAHLLCAAIFAAADSLECDAAVAYRREVTEMICGDEIIINYLIVLVLIKNLS